MSVEHLTVPRIRCDRADEITGRCTSRLYGDDTLLSVEKVRVLARERSWSVDGGDFCPSHARRKVTT